jgi:hypothetical protein
MHQRQRLYRYITIPFGSPVIFGVMVGDLSIFVADFGAGFCFAGAGAGCLDTVPRRTSAAFKWVCSWIREGESTEGGEDGKEHHGGLHICCFASGYL